MSGTEYPKIWSPFMRHTEGELRNKLDTTRWRRPEFAVLQKSQWHWSEKINGKNARIIWDGHRVSFGGRTDNAQMPVALVNMLRGMFPEELMEQQFGATEAVLYGEGFGGNIHRGSGIYANTPSFALFDVKVGPWWLLPPKVQEVADQMKIGLAPPVFEGLVAEAFAMVTHGVTSAYGDFPAEGLVGRPPLGLTGRDGDRLLMKVKTEDFQR